jgi:predicted N-acetyltransferase YhbS
MNNDGPMMEFRSLEPNDASVVEELFASVFSKSEGEREGALIGRLAYELIAWPNSQEVYGFVAAEREQILGAIFFSRLTFNRPLEAFILAPVAVHSDYQGKGIGQALIAHGLHELKLKGVSFVATYGDPAFYSKVGFQSISQNVIRPPYKLSQPEGWLGQSLAGNSLEAISGSCSCVKAFDNQAYW